MTIEEKKEGNITDAVILLLADEITRIKNNESNKNRIDSFSNCI